MARKPETVSAIVEKSTRKPEESADKPKPPSYIHPAAKPFAFLGDEKFVNGFIWLPIIGLIVTIMAGFIYPFEDKYAAPWDFFASWGVIGFVAYCIVVLSAEPLFKFLSRDETYYGERTDD